MDKESDCVARQFNICRLVSQTCEHLSKTTKLLLLDSLLQEVCISSGFDGSLTLEFARVECLSLSVTNLLYSRLKKAYYTKEIH